MATFDNLKAKAVDIIDPRLRLAVEKLMGRNEYVEAIHSTTSGRKKRC